MGVQAQEQAQGVGVTDEEGNVVDDALPIVVRFREAQSSSPSRQLKQQSPWFRTSIIEKKTRTKTIEKKTRTKTIEKKTRTKTIRSRVGVGVGVAVADPGKNQSASRIQRERVTTR